MKKRLASLMLPLLVLASTAATAEPANYTLTRQYGSVLFKVLQEEYINLVGRFDDYGGKLVFDPDDLAATRLDATVNMASVNMGDKDVAELLVSSSAWFNTGEFPEATFSTESVEVVGVNVMFLHGQLTFMGITMPWVMEATFHGGADGSLAGSTVGMVAVGNFLRSDFGLDQYMNVADDRVTIEVNAKFRRD